jgi:hypothetical protein
MKLMLVLFVSLFPLLGLTIEKLSMKDLESLAQKNRHREVLTSAERVPPSERNEKWESIVTNSTKAFIKSIESEVDRQWTFEIGNLLTKEHPHLKKDKELMASLGDLAVRTYSTKGVATPFYVEALSKDDKRCADESVHDAVTDAFVKGGSDAEVAAAKKIAFDLCLKQLDENWARQMVESKFGMESACAGLLKSGKLTGVKKRKCEQSVKESK